MDATQDFRDFRFLIGADEVQKNCTFKECRFFAYKLAAEAGKPVTVHCYNNRLFRWDNLGTALPNGLYIDAFGGANTINSRGDGYDYYGKYDEWHSKDDVVKRARPCGPHITCAATNKIEFDNGVRFVYDFAKKAYRISKGVNVDYPAGLAEYIPN